MKIDESLLNKPMTYKELCRQLNLPYVNGSGKPAQLKQLKKYCTYIITSHPTRYIITSLQQDPEYKPYKYKLQPNDVFGNLTVIEFDETSTDRPKYICQCSCGNIISVEAYHLLNGQQSCMDCRNKKLRTSGKAINKYIKYKKYHNKERDKLTPTLRYKILKRDNFHCCLCGRGVEDGVKLEVDHKTSMKNNGLTEADNLWTLCFDCNRGKGSQNF